MRRIDADRVPWATGGQPMDFLVNSSWSTGVGDINVGAKLNLLSQQRSKSAARRRPRRRQAADGGSDKGLGTGKIDFFVDGIVSREAGEKVDVAAYVGVKVRSDPDDYTLSNGLRWGFGFGYPSRGRVSDLW